MTRFDANRTPGRGHRKLRTTAYALLMMAMGLSATAMPAAAGCVYPSLPDLDGSPQLVPGIINPVDPLGSGSHVLYQAGGVYVFRIGCIVGPPLPPDPCSPARGDCFLPITPPSPPEPGHHQEHACGAVPLASSQRKQKAQCGYHTSVFFGSARSLSAQWA
jgi:hypothetical protein